MNPASLQLLLAAAALSALFSAGLASLAPRLGWLDAADGGRKRQSAPLATVGGVALALALLALWPAGPALAPSAFASSSGKGAALLAALAVGLVDDLAPRGLRPRAKLAGQALAGLVLAGPLLARGAAQPSDLLAALGLVLGAVVAQNAWNTFDNADGAASGLALLALAPGAPLLAAALVGFLPFNLRRSRAPGPGGARPQAILGDAGSHLLGMAVFVTPLAWPVLALPLFDLARVAVERLRCGQAPWIGDRRHLAHRLERSGASPLLTAGILAGLAAPSALLGWATGSFSVPLALAGVLLTLAGAFLGVALTRARGSVEPAAGAARELGPRGQGPPAGRLARSREALR